MKKISYILENEESLKDFLKRVEIEMPNVMWDSNKKPNWYNSISHVFPTSVIIKGETISFGLEAPPMPPIWKIGQSIPKSALEQLTEIPENEDGSITISKELQVQLVMELKACASLHYASCTKLV